MFDVIEEKIQAEALKRATAQMKDFIPPLETVLDGYGLAPETILEFQGINQLSYRGNFRVTVKSIDEQLKQTVLEALTKRIAEQLRESFTKKTADIDPSTL
jgi:hypothetical protein